MITGFDELVEQLLYDLALAGNAGIGSDELDRAVRAFYARRKQPEKEPSTNDGDILFSSTPPTTSTTVIDNPFIDAVWFWLKKHPDVQIIDDRIFTNEERIWQVIAGHGVDYSRIPAKQFECLTVIAAHGPEGVLQPDVRRITGQAKQSVPHRTDVLAQRGYITKEQVLAKSANTTLLTLRRFSKDALGPQHVHAYPESTTLVADVPVWHFDVWYDKMVELLKANDNIIVVTDLIIGLGIYDDRNQTRAFRRAYNRAVESGMLRRVSAPVEGGRIGDGSGEEYVVRCLQLLREPTEFDRGCFKKNCGPDKINRRFGSGDQTRDQVNGREPDVGLDDSDLEDVDDKQPADNRVHPQWIPDLCYHNFIYNIIDNAGVAGITSMALNELAGGHFWRRPVDEMMLRLTDVWQHSQPSHLKHLSIVRDTGAQGKINYFHFRTLPNFKKAVELGHTSWEAVQGDAGKGKGTGKRRKDVVLDQWGFPKLRADVFEGDGTASLRESQASVRTALGFAEVGDGETPSKRPYKKRKLDDASPQTLVRPASAATGPATFHQTASPNNTAATTAVQPSTILPSTPKPSSIKQSRTANDTPASRNNTNQGSSSPTDMAATSGGGKRKRKATEEAGGSVFSTGPPTTPATRTEVKVNPPGSYPEHLIKPGRRRGAMVAVFRSPKLIKVSSFDRKESRNTAEQPTESTQVVPIASAITDDPQSSRAPAIPPRQPSTQRAAVETTPVTNSPSTPQASKSVPSTGSAYSRLEWVHTDPARRSFKRRRGSASIDLTPIGPTPTRSSEKRPQRDTTTANTPRRETPRISRKKRRREEETDDVEATRETPVQFFTSLTRGGRAAKAAATVSTSAIPSQPAPRPEEVGEIAPDQDTPVTTAKKGLQKGKTTNTAILLDSPALRPSKRQRDDDTAEFGDAAFQEAISIGQLPKRTKRGRPSKAEIAERERLLQAITAASNGQRRPSLVTKLPIPSQAEQQSKQSLVVRLPFKTQIAIRGLQGILQGTTDTRSYQLGYDAGGNRVAAQVENTGLEPKATGTSPVAGPQDTSERSLATKSRRESLLVNLSLPARHDLDRDTLAVRGQDDSSLIENATTPSPGRHTKQIWPTNAESAPESGSKVTRTPHAKESTTDIDRESEDLPELFAVDDTISSSTPARTYSKFGTVRNGGIMDIRRQEIVLDIVRQAGGVCPGDNDIFHTFSMQWQAQHGQIPGKHTVEHAVGSLVDSGTLRMYKFVFTGSRGTEVPRHIIVDPEDEATKIMADVRAVQKEIIDQHPYRLLQRTVQLMKRLSQDASEEHMSRKTRTLDDSDDDYEPDERVEFNNSIANPTIYFAEYPVIAGLTVKRTAQALAVAESETPQSNTPRSLRGIKSRMDHLLDEDDTEDSDEYEEDETTPIDPGQAAAMNSFGVERYVHDSSATPSRYAIPRPRKAFTQQTVKSASLIKSFARPSGQVTDGTDSDSDGDADTGKRILRARKADADIDWQHISSTPADLDEVLKRTRTLGNRPPSNNDSLFWRFQSEVDNVMAFEMALDAAGHALGSSGEMGFVNHGLNQPHTLASADFSTQSTSIDFVEGFLAVGKAEKLRAIAHGRKTRQKRVGMPATAGAAQKPSASKAVSSEKGPQAAGFSLDLEPPRSGAAVTNHPQQLSLSQSAIPGPVAASPNAPETRLPYNTRFKGEGRPRLNWSKDFQDFEVIPRAPVNFKPARIPKNTVSQTQKERLVVALALQNVLCGGAHGDPTIRWEIVAHAFAFTQEANNLRQRWKGQRHTVMGSAYLKTMEDAIREPFLKAYEKGELPKVDFSQLNKTDWPALVRWVETTVLPLGQDVRSDGVALSREQVKEQFELVVDEVENAPLEDKDDTEPIHSLGTNQYTRPDSTRLDHNAVLEKSWIRALVVTKDEFYDEYQATQKLGAVKEEKLAIMLKEMIETKTIMHVNKGRQQAGRNYALSKHTMSQFNRWSGEDGTGKFCLDLAAAWKTLAEHFQLHDKLELRRDVTEAEMIVLNNLVANGKIRIVPVLPMMSDDFSAPAGTLSKWGMGGYTHNPKEVDESQFKLTVVYAKTASFGSKHGLKPNVKVPTSPKAVLGEPGFRIPFWMDIHGNHISDIWRMVLRSILHFLVYRQGCTPSVMEKAHDNKLWAWEIELALTWMENVGMAERCGVGNGWRTGEWWFCAFMPEIAG